MINVDDIKVGDLISRYSSLDDCYVLGYVIRIINTQFGSRIWCNWSNGDQDYEGWVPAEDVKGHWKVIKFEEENKMKTLKKDEKLNLLLNGKELQKLGTDTVYRIKGSKLEHKNGSTKHKYITSKLAVTDLLNNEFVEYKDTLKDKFKVGDWVRVTLNDKRVWLIQVAEVDEDILRGTIYEELTGRIVDQYGSLHNFLDRKFELISSEQVKEHKVGRVFKTVGRNPFEYKSLDVVMYSGELYLVDYVEPNGLVNVFSMEKTWLTRIAVPSKELEPIYFVENKVNLELEG